MALFGQKLNPFRRLREPLGVKGIRQSVVVTNNPSTIDQNQQLLVRFPNLGPQDVIVPGTARLAFTITLNAREPNRAIVKNLGRAVVKKTTIRMSGNEVMSIDDSDLYHCYTDLWKTQGERRNLAYQGIDTDYNMLKLRVGAADGDAVVWIDKAIADTYGNRFYIPLDFELLESHMPFYQSALGDRLEYELTFNDYSRVIRSSDPAASYTIDNIALEYDTVTEPNLTRMISSQYAGRLAILYDRVLRHRKMTKDKSDTLWNINLNIPARSMKGILMLFEDPGGNGSPWARETEEFYNPKIQKVEITIEGVPNQLYSQGMRAYQQWDEAKKHFLGVGHYNATVAMTAKDLALTNVSIADYLTNKYALWLDLRSTDDNALHGTGRRIENASEGVTIQITKEAEAAGSLNVYMYVITDAQLNIQDGRYVSAIY